MALFMFKIGIKISWFRAESKEYNSDQLTSKQMEVGIPKIQKVSRDSTQ